MISITFAFMNMGLVNLWLDLFYRFSGKRRDSSECGVNVFFVTSNKKTEN